METKRSCLRLGCVRQGAGRGRIIREAAAILCPASDTQAGLCISLWVLWASIMGCSIQGVAISWHKSQSRCRSQSRLLEVFEFRPSERLEKLPAMDLLPPEVHHCKRAGLLHGSPRAFSHLQTSRLSTLEVAAGNWEVLRKSAGCKNADSHLVFSPSIY